MFYVTSFIKRLYFGAVVRALPVLSYPVQLLFYFCYTLSHFERVKCRWRNITQRRRLNCPLISHKTDIKQTKKTKLKQNYFFSLIYDSSEQTVESRHHRNVLRKGGHFSKASHQTDDTKVCRNHRRWRSAALLTHCVLRPTQPPILSDVEGPWSMMIDDQARSARWHCVQLVTWLWSRDAVPELMAMCRRRRTIRTDRRADCQTDGRTRCRAGKR